MRKLNRAAMAGMKGGETDCLDLDYLLWGAIAVGQPEIALLIWGIMVGKGCFAK